MNPFKIILVILIVVLVGGGVALATGAWNPGWNPFKPSPEHVIQQMIKKMAEVETASSEGEIYFEVKEADSSQSISISMALEADSDATDPENPKSDTEMDLGLSYAMEGLSLNFTVGLQAITIGQTFYLNITSIPGIPAETKEELAAMGLDFNQLVNQWIKIDEESLKAFYEAMGMDSADVEKAFGQNEKYQEMGEELSKELMVLMEKRTPDLLSVEALSDTEIEGVDVYHYKAVLDKEGVKTVIPEVIEIFEEPLFAILEEQYGITITEDMKKEWEDSKEEKLAELDEGIDELFEKTGEVSAELWIGKEDYYLYKIKSEKAIDFGEFESVEPMIISFGLDLNFSNFNQPMTIDAPLEYKGFDEIFLPIIEMMMLQSMMMSPGGLEPDTVQPPLYPMLFLSPLTMTPSSEPIPEESWSQLLRASLLGVPF